MENSSLKVLKNKRIILGITGSIAAYKSIELIRRLTEAEATVDVILTEAAKRFITPLTFSSVTKGKVYTDLFEEPLSHIRVAEEATLLVIAPATADIIGKIANGIADDMLTTVCMAFKGKVIIAPAMNWRMFENEALQRNLRILHSREVIQVGPDKGPLACGEVNTGRMADIEDILDEIEIALTEKDLTGRRIVITAGPTREYIDPVRFISNRSSGKMGYALAEIAARRGAEAILISGPSNQRPPRKVSIVYVETTTEMRDAVLSRLKGSDVLIMAAAPADFSPEARSPEKIDSRKGLQLNLRRTPDILKEVSSQDNKPLIIGFAAETDENLERARQKLVKKGLDMIIFNNVTIPGAGFDVDTNKVTIIERDKEASLPIMTKEDLAVLILDRVSDLLRGDIPQG